MEQPEGYHIGSSDIVCKLNKTLYGIKQAPNAWNEEINGVIISLGFKRCISDSCLYIKQINNRDHIVIGLFVDDIIVLYDKSIETYFNQLKSQLFNRYKMKYLDNAKWILGMRIIRDRKNKQLYIDQETYVSKVLKQFNMDQCNSIETPTDGNKLTGRDSPETDEEKQSMVNKPYRQVIGSLLYTTISVRPDISFIVNALSRFNNNPGEKHWTAAKRVLRYLQGTKAYGLLFKNYVDPTSELIYTLNGYCDADWGGNLDDRRSTTGYIVTLNNCIISWNSKRQTTVAQSSIEAEYMSIAAVVNDIKWIHSLCRGDIIQR